MSAVVALSTGTHSLLGTHDVQYINITVTASNTLCVEFYLVGGLTSTMPHVHLVCDELSNVSFQAVISDNDPYWCFPNISANTCTVYVCNEDSLAECMANPAVVLEDVTVTNAASLSPPIPSPTTTTATATTGTPLLPGM